MSSGEGFWSENSCVGKFFRKNALPSWAMQKPLCVLGALKTPTNLGEMGGRLRLLAESQQEHAPTGDHHS